MRTARPAEERLESTANTFRRWVCSELASATRDDREGLRGDYVFVIDAAPRFVVSVEADGAGSIELLPREPVGHEFVYDERLPHRFTEAEIDNLFESSHRVRVATDSSTLLLLLRGQLKAKVAYLNGRVTIDGDLPAFLRLVGLLKSRGVRPLGVSEGAPEL